MGVYDSPTFYEFNADACVGRWDMPTLEPVDFKPSMMVGFNYARSIQPTDGMCIHFFLDDVQFERVWNQPYKNVEALGKFAACLTPDFSLFRNMPQPMMIWNIFRSRLFGQLCQRRGLTVIPTVSWADESSFDYCFDGLPVGGDALHLHCRACKGEDGVGDFRARRAGDVPQVQAETHPVLWRGRHTSAGY